MTMTTRAFSLDDKFRPTVAKQLAQDPHSIISLEDIMEMAAPLFRPDAAGQLCCPELLDRLKRFLRGPSRTAETVNASSEFPRFGIVKASASGLCNPQTIKTFMDRHGLLFTCRRGDRLRAITASNVIDDAVRQQLALARCEAEPIQVTAPTEPTTRDHGAIMLFISPITLMLAIDATRSKADDFNRFKRQVGHLRTLMLVVEEERVNALAASNLRLQAEIQGLRCCAVAGPSEVAQTLSIVYSQQTAMHQAQAKMAHQLQSLLAIAGKDDDHRHAIQLSRCRIVFSCIWVDPLNNKVTVQVGYESVVGALDVMFKLVTHIRALGAVFHSSHVIAVCDVSVSMQLPAILSTVLGNAGVGSVRQARPVDIPAYAAAMTQNDFFMPGADSKEIDRSVDRIIADLQSEFISRQLFGVAGLLESSLVASNSRGSTESRCLYFNAHVIACCQGLLDAYVSFICSFSTDGKTATFAEESEMVTPDVRAADAATPPPPSNAGILCRFLGAVFGRETGL